MNELALAPPRGDGAAPSQIKQQQSNNIAAPSNSTITATESSASSDLSLSASSQTRLLLLRAVHCAYRRWAFFIVRHSRAVILFCTLLSALCTLKVATTPHQNDITGYTPYGARSRQELAIREQFFNSAQQQGMEGGGGAPFGVFILLLPRMTGNFLNETLLAEAAQIDEFVRHNFPLKNGRTNRTETFAQFCRDFCELNEPLRRFEEGFRLQSERIAANESVNPTIRLDYPVSSILGRKFNIQPNFFGIHFARNESSQKPQFTNMDRIGMLALNYKAERIGGWTDQEIKQWEMAVSHHFEGPAFKSANIRVLTASTTYVELEVVRAGLSMLPFLIVGFSIMFCCTFVSMLLSAAYMNQFSLKKLWLALMACVCPFMATGTALGLLFICGVRFGSVLCVTPFLVLAIGVDDAYLMIHAWQRVGKERKNAERRIGPNEGEMQAKSAVAQRLALVLVDTGPAILISALTNICADAIGSFTGSPEITLLCVGNMAAIAVDFCFQITFYAAVMALVGESEYRAAELKEAKRRFQLRIPIGTLEDGGKEEKNSTQNGGGILVVNKMPRRSNLARHIGRREKCRGNFNEFLDDYVRLITKPWVAIGLCALWFAFLAFSALGISRFEVNLSTKKLFASDSPLLEIDHYREQQIVPFFTMATVFVNAPGNLSDPQRMGRLNELLAGMEGLPESWGPQSTNYFVRELAQFVGDEEQEGEGQLEGVPLMERLKDFLDWPENRFWRAFLRFGQGERGEGQLERFFFTTAYHGQKLTEWPERTRLLMQWRAIVDRFAEFNVSVFHEEGIFLDLIDNMPTDAWQSAVATLICMCLVCAIFMGHDWRTVLVAGASIGSIICGTLGILAWMGVSMDPIMMAALIISIGFSVDIPAHVSYHFYSAGIEEDESSSSPHSSPRPAAVGPLRLHRHSPLQLRLRTALVSVGAPALQASLSTSLCVLALLFVPLYMAQIFVQIMCACILLCILHSLLLIPALFALIDLVRKALLRLNCRLFGQNNE